MQQRFIVDLIVDLLECDNHWWTQDLLTLMTLSTAWLGPVRKQLYSCPRLRSFRACSLLARSLAQNPCLKPLLHGIDLRPTIDRHVHDGIPTEMDGLRFILSLDGLRSITLGGELAIKAERFLRLLTNSQAVIEMHIDGTVPNEPSSRIRSRKPASLEWDDAIAFTFPNLRRLKLSRIELIIIYPSIPYQLPVTHLTLDNVDIIGGYIHHLLNQSWSSLQCLFVTASSASEFDEHIKLMLDCCGPTLQNLHYEVQRDGRSDGRLFDEESTHCPSLRQLHLRGMEMDLETLCSIGQVCQSLEELVISGRMVRIRPLEWVTFIRSGALPSLRRLSTPWGTNYPPFAHWSKATGKPVMEASAKRCVYLTCK